MQRTNAVLIGAWRRSAKLSELPWRPWLARLDAEDEAAHLGVQQFADRPVSLPVLGDDQSVIKTRMSSTLLRTDSAAQGDARAGVDRGRVLDAGDSMDCKS